MSTGVSYKASSVRHSFAEVAASTYTPKIITATEDNVATGRIDRLSNPIPNMNVLNESGKKPVSQDPETNSCTSDFSSGIELNLQTFVDGNLVLDTKASKNACMSIKPKNITMDGYNTASISSGNSTKRSTGDDRSTESGTASILDEKESLRPDDSASLKASDDEDPSNVSQSLGLEDSQGGDSKIIAPKDEMSAIRSAPRLDQTHETWQPGALQKVTSPEIQKATYLNQQVSESITAENLTATQSQAMPDEKLLEALQTPRDRVFILKLEQDIMHFIQNSKDPSIELPQSNSFHRLLAHRLADYYLLGHTVDNGLGAVRLHRTAYVRLPQTLGNMAKSIGLNENEQRTVPTRMIMRRDSQPRAKSFSLSGMESILSSEDALKPLPNYEGYGSNDGSQGIAKQPTVKIAMTREEREAKYNEARQRIFGSPEDLVTNGQNAEEKNESRSNSINGKKRVGKIRDYLNDGFEARPRPGTIHPSSMCASSYPSDLCYHHYPLLVHNASYGCLNAEYPPVLSPHHQSSPETEVFKKAPWSVQQFSPTPGSTSYGHVYNSMATALELSAEFQQGLQIFQNPTTSGQTPVKSPTQVHTTIFGQLDVAPEVATPSWHAAPAQNPGHMTYQSTHQSPPTTAVPNFGHNNFAIYTQQYPYGKLPDPTITNGKSKKDQHPIPGSYNRQQQFNPHSQSFVPISQQRSDSKENLYDANLNTSKSARSRSGHSQIPFVSCGSSMNRTKEGSSALITSAQGLAHPLPQPVSVLGTGQSTIAKWGTPSHLPPKPPPPALFTQSKTVNHCPTKDGPNRSIGLQNLEGTSAMDDINGEGLLEVNQHRKSC